MKSFNVKLYHQQTTVMANSPRQAVKLAVDSRAIPSSAWRWLGDATTEGFYGPLSIVRNTLNQKELFA